MVAKQVHITGRVQGVGFRAWTLEQAQGLGVSGWVRNRPDGSVEAVVSGSRNSVEALITALHEGPPAALVEHVRVGDAEVPAAPGFHIDR